MYYLIRNKNQNIKQVMKSNIIKSFSVYGLFGTDDVHIPFDENIKILIGENGLGKTQVLNLFYYTLSKNFAKLSEFFFDRVELVIGKETLTITIEQIEDYLSASPNHAVMKDIIDRIGSANFKKFRLEMSHRSPNSMRNLIETHPAYRRLRGISTDYIFNLLREGGLENLRFPDEFDKKMSQNLFTQHLSKCSETIDKFLLENEILYFPTYRRVEEDLHSLGYDDDDDLLNQENTLIQFGMDDVQKRFNQIESQIDKSIKDGFSKFSSELVNQFFKDDETSEEIEDEDYLKDIDENDIEILLSRIGDKISESKKAQLKNIVLSKQLQDNDSQLNLLLKKLIENYSSQKESDNSVKEFRDVCNNYLVNKKVFYDESAIKINIKSERNNSEIELSKLSSGEKQIISMFSKIYLSDTNKRFLVLFDEPELSLSMKWQKQLLPDIFKSDKCDFLLAVTHSPFIFDNELDKYAIGLNEYITSAITAK
jgi:predicted ATP-binding protein involved in virulence